MNEKVLLGTWNNEEVYLCTLTNKQNLQAEIITLGATVKSIWVKGKDGSMADVVLGQDGLEQYIENDSCSASVIGRVTNRIGGASFQIGERISTLENNDGGNCLHSGSGCYAEKNFTVKSLEEDRVVLSLTDCGEGGFPGKVSIQVEYQVTEKGEFAITYTAVPSEDTPINITNHSYFNLGGHASGVPENHKIMICADFYTEVDQNCLPTGAIKKVEGTALDFRKPKRLGDQLKALEKSSLSFGGYDHNFVIRGAGYRQVASVVDEESGRQMEVYSDCPGMQFYTANHLDGISINKQGAVYSKHCAYCFETQNFPNAVNISHFPDSVVKAGETWHSRTVYRFSIV